MGALQFEFLRLGGLLAVQNLLMGALQFEEKKRTCDGLLAVQTPLWKLYNLKIFAPAAGYWRCKVFMGAL